MTFSRRQVSFSAFLAVFALGFWLASVVPGSILVSGFLVVLWFLGTSVLGWRWFVLPVPGPTTPVLAPSEPVAVTVEPSEPVEAVLENLEPEPLSPEAPLPEVGFLDDLRHLIDLLEAAWDSPDPWGPALEEVLANEAFIRENVQRSFEVADNLSGSAERAFSLSEKVQMGVSVVTEALAESLKQTEVLSQHSERITGILGLMAEVSDKIHVLSINASIVSARAGVAGRGFEVVAKEIRALAKESESSLGGIVEVIELLRSSIAQVIRVVKDADAETEQEKGALIEVAGALQGVSLGVEIVKAVSSFARDKAGEQERLLRALPGAHRDTSPEIRTIVADLKACLATFPRKKE